MARELPQVRWIQMEENVGFAAAAQVGIDATSSPWLLMLNNDATIERDALRLIAARDVPDDVGTVALQMRFTSRPEIVNSAGLGVDVLGVAYDRFLGTPADGPAS